jgi:short-subunit dehydrogenase
MSDTNRGKTALVTGSSGGIGYEFARLFAQDGCNLVLVARSEATLLQQAEEFKRKFGVTVKVIAKDLTHPEAAQELFEELQAASIKVDILVNNAGFAAYGFFSEIELSTELEMMQLNMVTLTTLTKLFLPAMLKQCDGKILNMASTAAFQPGPLMAVYYATKAYVLSLSEALANELENKGVTVTALCPGPTQSGFQQRAAMEDSKLVKGKKIMDSATVAKIGYEALLKGQPVVVPGLMNLAIAQLARFVPRKMVTKLVRNAQERVH